MNPVSSVAVLSFRLIAQKVDLVCVIRMEISATVAEGQLFFAILPFRTFTDGLRFGLRAAIALRSCSGVRALRFTWERTHDITLPFIASVGSLFIPATVADFAPLCLSEIVRT